MTHRASQVTQGMVDTIRGFALLAVPALFSNREFSLSEEAGELPCVCVNENEDAPVSDEGNDNLAFIDSLLDFEVTGYAVGIDEAAVEAELQRQRRYIHACLLAYLSNGQNPLGLPFVIAIKYAGASKSERTVSAEQCAGKKTSFWRVHYRMRVTDPGDD